MSSSLTNSGGFGSINKDLAVFKPPHQCSKYQINTRIVWFSASACLCSSAMTHTNLSESTDLSHKADTALTCEIRFLCARSFFPQHKEGKSSKGLLRTLTHICRETHTQSFSSHIMSLCVNNPAISDCRIISTCVGSRTHTHIHTLTKSSTHELWGHNGPLSAFV